MRQRTGVNKITIEQVRLIRRGFDAGVPAREFAQAYGLSVEQVRRIGRRESWAWVPEDGSAPQRATVYDLTPPATGYTVEEIEQALANVAAPKESQGTTEDELRKQGIDEKGLERAKGFGARIKPKD